MEIYEETYEGISYKLKLLEEAEKEGKSKTVIPEDMDDDDALDMFMDTATKAEEASDDKKAESKAADAEKAKETTSISLDDEVNNYCLWEITSAFLILIDYYENWFFFQVKWEFRWENEEAAEVHGPHSTEEMIKWQENGFFDKGVYVRKVGGGRDFSDVKRIDFDLYT